MTLIRQTGSRLSILNNYRLVDLWREYSARQYCGGWIEGARAEILGFLVWAKALKGLDCEITASQRAAPRKDGRLRVRRYVVRGWNEKPLSEQRLHVASAIPHCHLTLDQLSFRPLNNQPI